VGCRGKRNGEGRKRREIKREKKNEKGMMRKINRGEDDK
jgi:hypothetical protein